MAHARSRLLAAACLGVAATLGGCSASNPITTQYSYAPSDGVRVGLTEEVRVENLLVLTEGEGAPAHVLGAVVNHSGEDAEVSLRFGEAGAEVPVRVGADETVRLSEEGVTVDVEAVPGSMLPATVGASGVGGTEVQVPVLDGTLPEYEHYLDEVTGAAAA
ncbi:hypothetical protein MF406_03065 [Georgenia sp. TF02-10]|uniref:hypothetical protein n=1 Tax=Georgenia sp. TF02-10 TaxID=2917725 RepID=UPI001FA74619|nr:hypothetical protein [Georgenia sp. TF02-10]UNX55270.1 hypothetical protein MF406_03065 [Georgenia sp. TF02-10]